MNMNAKASFVITNILLRHFITRNMNDNVMIAILSLQCVNSVVFNSSLVYIATCDDYFLKIIMYIIYARTQLFDDFHRHKSTCTLRTHTI
jgi:hypothetical protein